MTKEQVIEKIKGHLSIGSDEASVIVEKAEKGGEATGFWEEWFEERFKPNVVFIDEGGYARMCIDALKILSTTAATDYGSSRQRDFGHLWADMTRGYLGELAFKIFLEHKGVEVELGHEVGQLSDYLPSDIHKIKKAGEEARSPCLKIGIKSTKWNGIWLDIPGDQFNHSDAHIFIKVGTGRDHLFAYFKKISVFRDKVLKVGQNIGLLSDGEADSMYDKLPTFRPIPAYVCGFVLRDAEYADTSYQGKMGRKNYSISGWNGPIHPGDIERIRQTEKVSGSVKFEGIGTFAHDKGYLFNTGNLIWGEKNWRELIDRL